MSTYSIIATLKDNLSLIFFKGTCIKVDGKQIEFRTTNPVGLLDELTIEGFSEIKITQLKKEIPEN